MVRLCVFVLCMVLLSGAVRAGDDDFASALQPVDCIHQGAQYNSSECVSYRRKLAAIIAARSKHPQGTAGTKPLQSAARGDNLPKKKTVTPALIEQERNAFAPRPIKPLAAASAPQPVPGKTPAERLRHMAGQLLLTGFAGREPEDADVARAARDVSEGRLSGVLVRDSNVESSHQLRQLVAALKNYSAKMPALIAIDQPGGSDTVLSEEKGFTFYGSANSVSSANSPFEAQGIYRSMASELAVLGITLSIGPSEDVCREEGVNLSALCFGTAPARIASYARAFNFGHHDRGVLTALRHVPFRAGLRTSAMNEPASSAILHLIVRGETSDALVVPFKAREPLSLTGLSFALAQSKPRSQHDSRSAAHGVLIFEMDMGPGGAPIRYQEAMLRAFQAGADMILIRDTDGLPPDLPALCLEAVQTGLKSGRLQLARIEDAYHRVQLLKERLRTVQPRTELAGLVR